MKLSAKISLLVVSLIVLSTTATLLVLVANNASVKKQVQADVADLADNEAEDITRSIYQLCSQAAARNQLHLQRDMAAARALLNDQGGFRLETETAEWNAVNQLTQQTTPVRLPKALLGTQWLGPNTAMNRPAPVADTITAMTGDFCTIFQRMNEAGDMLRVCTSVTNAQGARVTGTYIPAKQADSADTPAIKAVLRGETYRGTALVVNDWHDAVYEPLWDESRRHVIGMIYAGISMNAVNADLKKAIRETVIGKTGYAYVLGSKGEDFGRFIVSKKGANDGESVIDTQDADGRPFIRDMIQKAATVSNGAIAKVSYQWKNTGESTPRTKTAVFTHFAPWSWVICASYYDEDYAGAANQVVKAQSRIIAWVGGTALLVMILAAILGHMLAGKIARSLDHVISRINLASQQIAGASQQVKSSSQEVAAGASEQAAALEESSASLEEMSTMTLNNAGNARDAKSLSDLMQKDADQDKVELEAMNQAMKAMQDAATNIARVNKTIDELAFQTNILALNAAVEAARAGDAGLGFAVVAEEVRSLAQRSAASARETASMIEDTIQKSRHGVELSDNVARSLKDMVEKSRKVNSLVADIASGCEQQSQGIRQINAAVSEMDKVTQGNAIHAEETAQATVDLATQAQSLNKAIAELETLIKGTSAPVPNSTEQHPHPSDTTPSAQGSRRLPSLSVESN